jgi:nucleoside phosphorylase
MLGEYCPDFVISAGFAGGLDDRLKLSSLFVATNFSDTALVARARQLLGGEWCFFGAMHTAVAAVETRAEKSRLAAATGACAVDMETRAIARICGDAAIPLLSLRVVSDTASTSLPVPFAHWFDLKRQRPRPFALVSYLALHPARIRLFYQFVRGLGPARAQLAKALVKLIATTPAIPLRARDELSRAVS